MENGNDPEKESIGRHVQQLFNSGAAASNTGSSASSSSASESVPVSPALGQNTAINLNTNSNTNTSSGRKPRVPSRSHRGSITTTTTTTTDPLYYSNATGTITPRLLGSMASATLGSGDDNDMGTTTKPNKHFLRLNASWFMFIRKLYLTYIVLLAAILVLLFGINSGLQLFYDFQTAKLQSTSLFVQLGMQFSLIGMLLMVTFVLSVVLAKCYKLMVLVWKEKQFQEMSQKFSSFFKVCGWGGSRIVDIVIQILLVAVLDVLPLISALAYGIATLSLSNTVQCYFSVASFVAFTVVIFWWIGNILENYKRLFMLLTKRPQLTEGITDLSTTSRTRRFFDEAVVDEDEDAKSTSSQSGVRPRSSRLWRPQTDQIAARYAVYQGQWSSDPQAAAAADVSHFSEDGTSVISGPENEDETTAPEVRHNLFFLLFHFCCWFQIPLPSKLKNALRISVKDIWWTIIVLLIIFATITSGILQLWPLTIVLCAIILVMFCEVLITVFVFIPPHAPSRRRLRHAWEGNFITRFVSVIEEAFYYSPVIVFRACTGICYILLITIAICFVSELRTAFLFFIVPLIIFLLIAAIYVLRFNLRRLFPHWRTQKILDGEALGLVCDDVKLAQLDVEEENLHNQMKFDVPFLQKVSVLSYVIAIFSFLFVIATSIFVFLGIISGLLFLLLCTLSCFIIFKRHETEIASAMVAFMLFLIALLGLIFVLGNIEIQGPARESRAESGHIIIPANGTLPYDVCDLRWHNSLNILDFAFFSALAYEPDPAFSTDLNIWFPGCHVQTGPKDDGDCLVKARFNQSVTYFDIHIKSKNLSIIAVRGTELLRDWIQDADIWKEIGFLQLASLTGPFLSFWPHDLTINIVWLVSLLERNLSPRDRFYYDELFEYTRSVMNHRNVILTGHSLGGGLAKIVGARLGLKAVTFCAPGIVYSSKKLGISNVEEIHSIATNVQPENDLVSMIDLHGGITQMIDCKESALGCHSLTNVIRELISSCGNAPDGRWILQ